jgi:hypothetical protein
VADCHGETKQGALYNKRSYDMVQTVAVSGVCRVFNNPDFSGETITVKEMLEVSGVSKATLVKKLAAANLSPIGKQVSGGRGRPSALYDRAAFMSAMSLSDETVTVSSESVADAVAEPVNDIGEVRTMSIDEINAALSET